MHINNKLIDHVAFATKFTDESSKVFHILGFENVLFYRQPIEKFDVYITKLQSNGGQLIELVEPISSTSVISKLLTNQSATIYHSAFLTNDLLDTLNKLRKANVIVITEPMTIPYPATEAHKNYRTSHLYHPCIGLFEVTGPIQSNKMA